MDLVQADFAAPHISAGETKVAHASEGELAKVAVLDAGRDERHGDVAENGHRRVISMCCHSSRQAD